MHHKSPLTNPSTFLPAQALTSPTYHSTTIFDSPSQIFLAHLTNTGTRLPTGHAVPLRGSPRTHPTSRSKSTTHEEFPSTPQRPQEATRRPDTPTTPAHHAAQKTRCRPQKESHSRRQNLRHEKQERWQSTESDPSTRSPSQIQCISRRQAQTGAEGTERKGKSRGRGS